MTAVDEAYQRYARLRDVLEMSRQTALSQPVSQRNQRVGLVGPDDRTEVARRKVEAAFAIMLLQAHRSGILDLCGAFEDAFRRQAATAVGEARRVIGQHYGIPVLSALKGRLVRDPRSFESLASITEAADGLISTELATKLRDLRNERNQIAHSPASGAPPAFSVEDALALLNQLIEAIW